MMPLYRVTVRTTSPGAGGDCLNVLHIRTVQVLPEPADTDLGEALTALETCYDSMSNVFPPGSVHHIGDTVIADPYGSPTYYPFTPVTSASADEGGVAPPAPGHLCGPSYHCCHP